MHTVDGPDAGTSLLAYLASFPRHVRDRGGEYERRNRVRSVTRVDDHTVAGEVKGSHLYDVELRRGSDGWRDHCSCPVGGGCKHVVAVALRWLARPPGAARPVGPPQQTFRQQWEPILADRLGRPLTSAEGAFLGRLANTFHNFRHSGSLRPDDVARLGFTTDQTRRHAYGAMYADWWEIPPGDPLQLWQYIAYDIESSGGAVPEFMRPITESASIRRQVAQRQRDQAVARWRDRFAEVATHAAATPAVPADFVPEPLEIRLRLEPDNWILETRPTPDAPWKPAPRALADRLMRDESGTLVRFALSPAAAAFIGICQQHYRRTYFSSFAPAQSLARELVQMLLAHRLARTLIVGPYGRPLQFSPAPLRWRLAHGAAGANEYELALHLPDGRPLPPSAVHLPLHPPQYLHDGVLYAGPPALDGGTAASAIVPAEVLEDPDVLGLLRKLGTEFPAEIEARFVTVPLRVTVACALKLDASENEVLTLSLRAWCDDPPLRQEWGPAGWSGGEALAGTAGKSGAIIVFDTATAERAAQHLGTLKVTYDHFRHAWTRRATRSFPEEFLTWREGLPPEVEVRADGELASLLGAPIRARIDVELLESAAHRDWFDLALVLKPEDTTLTREEISLLLKARGKLVRIPGKGWRRLAVQLDDATAAALEDAGFDREALASAALTGERHRFHALQLSQAALAERLPQQQADALRARARAIAAPQAAEPPAGLRADLRPYQRDGFQFLAFLSANGLGGVLADDMGLGKTVQTLAWLLWLAERQGDRPLRVLVVCPKSVVGNWETEAAKFAPSLRIVRFSPTAADAVTDALGRGPVVVVANYAQLRLNAGFFSGQRWQAVILDEGQFIKTPTSRVAQIARELPGEHRVVLTGTPIENRLLDLWSLFAFSLPGLLGSQAAFKRHYSEDNPLALPRLRARVRHFLLRRTKAQVAADLPPRTEEDVTVELEGEQARLYQAELKRARAQLLKIQTSKQLDQARFNILASLLRLRQICCHPALVDPALAGAESAKLEELLERVEELRDEGHQVLVFSQFVTMLELIREKLVAAGIGHLMLTGQTEDREALVREFQSGKQHTVFLLSLKAAGFGLNLTAASYVILYDPWWNPAVEAQAIDRTHRIGQQVPVIAYRLIARGTIEEKIRALQHEKAALAGAIVQEESLASVLDLDSLRQILA